MELDEFRRDRREALMDISKLEAYCKKYRITMPTSPEAIRLMILKARTACKDLPESLRREAKASLLAVGSESMDNGDLA